MTKKTIGWSVKKFLKWKRERVAETTYEHYACRLRVVLNPIHKTKLKAVTSDIVRATLKAADDGRRRATRSASRRALSNYQRFLIREKIISKPWLSADDLRSHGSDRRARRWFRRKRVGWNDSVPEFFAFAVLLDDRELVAFVDDGFEFAIVDRGRRGVPVTRRRVDDNPVVRLACRSRAWDQRRRRRSVKRRASFPGTARQERRDNQRGGGVFVLRHPSARSLIAFRCDRFADTVRERAAVAGVILTPCGHP